MHQRFELRVGFGGELALFIEAGQQGGDGFSLVSEDEIVIAGFAFFGMQIKGAPVPFIRIILVLGIVEVAVIHKIRIEIGEFGCVVIFLIVSVLEDPDTQTVRRVGVGEKLDPFAQLENTADVGQRGLFSVDAVVAAGTVAFDGHAAQNGGIPVVKVDDIHLAGEFSRLGVIAAL